MQIVTPPIKRKRGRPRKPVENKRSEKLAVMVSPEYRAWVDGAVAYYRTNHPDFFTDSIEAFLQGRRYPIAPPPR
jgi:hypothetical protein